MGKPAHHLFVCSSFRAKGDPQGVCHKKSNGLLAYIEGEILDRGMDAMVTSTGCLKRCDDGPVLVVYPAAQWYGRIESEDAVDAILDAIEEGGQAEEHLL
jgi:(2Fe-2S) ferredoxin